MGADDHFALLKQELLNSFGAAFRDLKPVIKDGATERVVDIMHKLRTHMLSLIAEARDA